MLQDVMNILNEQLKDNPYELDSSMNIIRGIEGEAAEMEIDFTFNGTLYWERVEGPGTYGITRIANGVVSFEKI